MNMMTDRRQPHRRRAAAYANRMIDRQHLGFTLIELVITIAIAGLLIGLAVPSFKAWLLSSQIRNAADSVQNGLQMARTSALTRNQLTTFTLQPAGWTVTLADGTVVQTWTAAEGAQNTVFTQTPADATQATFNGLGQRVANGDGTSMLTQIGVAAATANTADIRTLNVVVGASGSIKMCDPHVNAGDPRAC